MLEGEEYLELLVDTVARSFSQVPTCKEIHVVHIIWLICRVNTYACTHIYGAKF